MRKTSTFLLIAFITTMSIISCKKETVTNNVTVTNRDTIAFKDTSVMARLTDKQWEFDSIYTGYTGPNTGTLIYVRGGSSHVYDNARGFYWRDGRVDYFDYQGTYYPGTFTFGTDSSVIIVTNTNGPATSKILRLDATHFTTFDSTNHALDIEIYKP